MSKITVRLEYGNMRFENDVEPGHVVEKITQMAERHDIDIDGGINPYGLGAAKGRAKLTGARATFKVFSQ